MFGAAGWSAGGSRGGLVRLASLKQSTTVMPDLLFVPFPKSNSFVSSCYPTFLLQYLLMCADGDSSYRVLQA